MKKYFKEINGEIIYRNSTDIVIEKDGMVTYNPTIKTIEEDGWIEFVQKEDNSIEKVKKNKLSQINRYDKSSNVNEFFINDIALWLDKNIRMNLKLRFDSETARGKENTSLWYKGVKFDLKLTDAINMLYELEEYASICYDQTQYHLVQVNSLQTIDEVESYDYKTGYPDKLHFDIMN